MVDLSANLCLFVLFAVGAAKNVSLYPAHFPRHLNTTPIYINSTGRTANPLIKALGVGQGFEKRQSTVLPTGTW
jgi:chitinase